MEIIARVRYLQNSSEELMPIYVGYFNSAGKFEAVNSRYKVYMFTYAIGEWLTYTTHNLPHIKDFKRRKYYEGNFDRQPLTYLWR